MLGGGDGRDQLFGRADNDENHGGHGADLLRGGNGDDQQGGGRGDDEVFAGAGVDASRGGRGDDVLWALAKADVSGENDLIGDTLAGGDGNDLFRVNDGEQDTVDCGPGRDVVRKDALDVLVDPAACEIVKVREPKADEDELETQE